MKRRPFCGDKGASAAFERWVRHLEARGVELNDADRLLVGLLASREANLQALRSAMGRSGIDRRLELELAEDRAARALGVALDRCERVFGPRLVEEEAVLVPAVGDGRVLPFGLRQAGAVEARVVAALAGGQRLTKDELRKRVKGAQGAFLAALRGLVAAGQVTVEGRGRKNDPKRYAVAVAEEA